MGKSEIRSTKSETNPNDQNPKPKTNRSEESTEHGKIRNSKSETNPNDQNPKPKTNHNEGNTSQGKIRNPKLEIRSSKYDLEERTYLFAKRVRAFVKKLPRTLANIEDGRQLIKASGSVGANYIEANEALSKKDFVMRIKICRKESKESGYWLRLVDTSDDLDLERECVALRAEAIELTNIFGSILRKSE